jgi:Lrp/AsnC family transcriptional regulator for asnA, asnC and gidA
LDYEIRKKQNHAVRKIRPEKQMKDSKRNSRAAAPPPRNTRAAEPTPASHLDSDGEINWKIIELLQEDGRMPFSTIAERIGVSEGTVRNRVNQLREDKVMEISASVLPEAFGYTWNSVVFIKLNARANIDKVAERLAKISEVYYVVHITGVHDLAITSYHRDREHFREFLNEHFYGHDDIVSVDANVNLKVYKVRLKWSSAGIAGE